MTYKKRLHDLNPCTSKEKAFLKTKKIVKPKKSIRKIDTSNTLQNTWNYSLSIEFRLLCFYQDVRN